ncbi:MAG: 3-phosphoshikimate 1-carboxyvinyltransferase [Deltaproteobacteria bacterium]|nr:3-phosphoshikimate 1-carboxyvinyltransferase [Deltaproteobacteria bacterium]
MKEPECRTVEPARAGLRGEVVVPGDKSVSHRAVMLASLARGTSHIRNFLPGADNFSTVNAMRALGVPVRELGDNVLEIAGVGLDGRQEPQDVIDCGNSGTTVRLLTGILAAQPFFSVLSGDASLRRRPMKRVSGALAGMGARITGRHGGENLPLAVSGGTLHPFRYNSPVASAQVKSALLLAGLFCEGQTTVCEPYPSRDHTERMLGFFGARVEASPGQVTVYGRPQLCGRELTVVGDISSAAFFMVAALLVPDSQLRLVNVGINPTRDGILEVLRNMGAHLELENRREEAGEPVADILVRTSALHGVEIGGALIPRLIDELPVLCVAAALAEGTTVIRDARELRVKETDRIAAMAGELAELGVAVETRDDGMIIRGGASFRGASVKSHGDHRVAMSMAVAGLRASSAVSIADAACTDISFPGFWEQLQRIVSR